MNMSEGISPKCPLCAETETNDHLFSCLGRSEWRTKLYQDLFSLLTKQHTAPLLKKVIIQGLRWQYEQHEPEFDLEIEHQTRIGWTHLVRGWIDKGWQTYQANYLRMHFTDDKKVQDTGKDWSLRIIEFMWQQGHKVWTDRCDKVHKKVKRAETVQQRNIAEAKTTALYKKAEDVGYYDRHKIFARTLKEKLQESARALQRWVVLATPAIKQAAREHLNRMKRNTQDIREFLKGKSQKVTKATRLGTKHKITKASRLGRKQKLATSQSSTTNNNNAPT
jgi:hypothetical protein